jgi:hypothetical protein
VVRVDNRITADFAGALDQLAVRQGTLHGNMGEVFFGMPPSPVSLSGICSQIELVHADMDTRSAPIREFDDLSDFPYGKNTAKGPKSSRTVTVITSAARHRAASGDLPLPDDAVQLRAALSRPRHPAHCPGGSDRGF